MALFCNKEVLDRAGVGEPPRTWDEYYEAARKTKAAGSYIEADAGDAGFFKSMIWAFGGHPYSASDDGRNVTINLTGDKGTQRFIDYWQKMSERILSIRSFPSGPTNGITAWRLVDGCPAQLSVDTAESCVLSSSDGRRMAGGAHACLKGRGEAQFREWRFRPSGDRQGIQS